MVYRFVYLATSLIPIVLKMYPWQSYEPVPSTSGTWRFVAMLEQMGIPSPEPLPSYNKRLLASYHFLQDQYPAVNFDFF
jgi:hypothetical protein